jgi:hypothetical protein
VEDTSDNSTPAAADPSESTARPQTSHQQHSMSAHNLLLQVQLWTQCLDDESSAIYYFCPDTTESSWELPLPQASAASANARMLPCSECEKRTARVACHSCGFDAFCLNCFRRIHAKGRRFSHAFQVLPIPGLRDSMTTEGKRSLLRSHSEMDEEAEDDSDGAESVTAFSSPSTPTSIASHPDLHVYAGHYSVGTDDSSLQSASPPASMRRASRRTMIDMPSLSVPGALSAKNSFIGMDTVVAVPNARRTTTGNSFRRDVEVINHSMSESSNNIKRDSLVSVSSTASMKSVPTTPVLRPPSMQSIHGSPQGSTNYEDSAASLSRGRAARQQAKMAVEMMPSPARMSLRRNFSRNSSQGTS